MILGRQANEDQVDERTERLQEPHPRNRCQVGVESSRGPTGSDAVQQLVMAREPADEPEANIRPCNDCPSYWLWR